MTWVRFTRAFEDGFAKYQKGQVVNVPDQYAYEYMTERFLNSDGTRQKPDRPKADPPCVRCDAPPPDQTPRRSGRRALYRFREAVAGVNTQFAPGQVYDLPVEVGDKYVERNIADKYGESVAIVQTPPDTAMRPSGRK